MSKKSDVEKKKRELADRLDKLIIELKSINRAFAVARKKSKQIIKNAYEKKDDNTVHALRKKMGLV